MIHQVKLSEQDLMKALEGQSFIRQDDVVIPKVLYKTIIYGKDHYKSMPETIIEQNRTYQKTDYVHQFPGHDELFAVYVLKK